MNDLIIGIIIGTIVVAPLVIGLYLLVERLVMRIKEMEDEEWIG